MIVTKNHSTLNTTKADTSRFKSPISILKESLAKISSKFSTSDAYYMVHNINQAIQNKKCRLKDIIKDVEFNRSEEILEKYQPINATEKLLPELTEYYKFYTQTSIYYHPDFFSLMHQHREKKKIVQYNRLKILLNLSQTQGTSQMEQGKKNSTISSFYILSKLNMATEEEQSQIMIAKLNSKMEKTFGPNCFRTIEQLDRNYHFQKKKTDVIPFEISTLKKSYLSTQGKQNPPLTIKSSNIKHIKRNSCENLQIDIRKTLDSKPKYHHKKKHLSMDNLTPMLKDCQIKENKPKLNGNWMKNVQNYMDAKGKIIKIKKKFSQSKFKSEETEKGYDIKSKITDTKQKIRKEKLQFKKKSTLVTNQSQIIRTGNKKSDPIATSPNQKHPNRKLMKIAFF